MSTRNQIFLAGDFRQQEAEANEEISPGHFVELRSDEKVQKHSTEGGWGEAAIALEDALQGNSIDDDYSAEDLVQFALCERGSVVQAVIKGGESVSIGDYLVSDGEGRLIDEDDVGSGVTVKQIRAVALEASDQTADNHVKVRIL